MSESAKCEHDMKAVDGHIRSSEIQTSVDGKKMN